MESVGLVNYSQLSNSRVFIYLHLVHHTAMLRTSQMFKHMLPYIFNVPELKQTLFFSKFLLFRNKTSLSET